MARRPAACLGVMLAGLTALLVLAAAPAMADADLLQQGKAALERGDKRAAIALTERAVRAIERSEGERSPGLAPALLQLAEAFDAAGLPPDALAANQRLLALRTSLLGARHPDTLRAMNLVATNLGEVGRYTEEVALNQQLLALSTEVLGPAHADTITAMADLAVAYGEVGRRAEQLALNEQAYELGVGHLGERDPVTLQVMNNLAYTYGELGRFDEQRALNERTWRLMAEVHGPTHVNTLTAASNLAHTYGQLGLFDQARVLAEQVLRQRTETLGEGHPHTLNSMAMVAREHRRTGRHEQGLALAERVLELRRKLFGPSHPGTLRMMATVASMHEGQGRHEQGLAILEQVLELRSRVLGPDHADTLETMLRVAAARQALGRQRQAAALSTAYVDGVEQLRARPGLAAQYRQTVFRTYAEGYRRFATMHAAVGEMPAAFRLSELGKARTLLEGLAAQRAGRGGALPQADLERLEDLNQQVAAFDGLLAGARDADSRRDHEIRRNTLVRSYQALQDELKRRHPRYAQLSEVRILDQGDLTQLLPDAAIAISYMVDGDHVLAFVVDTSGSLQGIDLGEIAQLGELVELVRRASAWPGPLADILVAQSRSAWRQSDGSVTLRAAGAAGPADAVPVTDIGDVIIHLGRRLLGPLPSLVLQARTWVVSPDGPLSQLPFELLARGPGERPLMRDVDVHYTQSLSVLAMGRALQRQYASLADRRSLLAVGNPVYEVSTAPVAERRRSALGSLPRVSSSLRDLDGHWPNLPGTEAEVRAVARLFPGQARMMLAGDATEHELQRLQASGEIKGYRYLLFSAHGYVSADEPALSSVVLGLQDRAAGTDGYVTAAEWPGYDLRSDLTVLSACDTGVGRVLAGEGVMGLPFALFVAGNVNTILTLWPVDDGATAQFVEALFGRIAAGAAPAAALAATKRDFAGHRRWSHPRYWAPFILVGPG